MEEATYASMGGYAVDARSAEDQAFVSTGGNAVPARSAEEAVFVSTVGYAVPATGCKSYGWSILDCGWSSICQVNYLPTWADPPSVQGV